MDKNKAIQGMHDASLLKETSVKSKPLSLLSKIHLKRFYFDKKA
ncbi:hypothetical protein HMPREF9446_02699 [Bacteroides fluxus YIT 12057]|uniref:Uncharacterized protein n=1 Tax=Bacteroides fluxus YIT 12057 TaxID=763034 RepID=F3PVC1_9BACE|nr:hypothetical protein HMPREF9446_02699 [Bacteroides fluxus YIT 12057]